MIEQALIDTFNHGGVIAYPTEAVYGLGCDPDNNQAIEKLLTLKQRSANKGLILIAANYSQLLPYIDDKAIPQHKRYTVISKWPGCITQILPANKNASPLLTGEHTTIAVRVTAHPLIVELCKVLGKPIISTSANISGEQHVVNWQQVESIFADKIDYLLKGETLGFAQPSTIIDPLAGTTIRS
jgi:L-threonylcarbamoyladenylate synthase